MHHEGEVEMYFDHTNQTQYAQERHREMMREAAIHHLLRVKRPLALHRRWITRLGEAMIRIGQRLQTTQENSYHHHPGRLQDVGRL